MLYILSKFFINILRTIFLLAGTRSKFIIAFTFSNMKNQQAAFQENKWAEASQYNTSKTKPYPGKVVQRLKQTILNEFVPISLGILNILIIHILAKFLYKKTSKHNTREN